ncbi:hypothetical protein B2G71_10195 [Novosphingobium sp. PC22D]|uniref:hypothetical protein n=1 Tax=Novosphingobium sp. PC22D TaxID=1962403 RepID=UPI000BFAFF40|nr:hypothetical protein [Novosphingobium sp. PC22D]PEQ12670.1 hypothetical protein B2G71_10195 [Novosphingobium sp. PC22D]
MNIIKKGILAATLGATALVTTTPAMARDYHDRGDNTAAIAIGAGIVGLALGAIIASDNKRDRYDDRYYVRDGWYYNDGYYYNRQGHRYARDDWQRRYNRDVRYDRRDRRYDNRRYDNRYDYGHNNGYYQRRGY